MINSTIIMLKTALFYYLLRTKIQCVSYFYIYKKYKNTVTLKAVNFFVRYIIFIVEKMLK